MARSGSPDSSRVQRPLAAVALRATTGQSLALAGVTRLGRCRRGDGELFEILVRSGEGELVTGAQGLGRGGTQCDGPLTMERDRGHPVFTADVDAGRPVGR